MRIGIGLNLLAPDNGGVTNYALTLLRHWPEFAPEHPMVLFSFAHNEPLLATLPPASRQHEIRLQTQEEALLHFDKIDVYFCPFGTLWPRPVRKPSVLTFHDMQERFYPEFFTAKELEERFFHYDWSLRMADAVVAVSAFTRDMSVQIAGAARGKFHVVPHAPDALPPPVKPAGWTQADDGRPFVFYPANFWKHKNHLRLLKAFGEARAGGADLTLVCTGSLLGREAEWREAIRASGVGDHVRHLGQVPRAEISWLFHHARALVFPSLFEGFGIPLVEAMQTGCSIACGPLLHATPACQAGACQVATCEQGYGNCDGNPRTGCETALLADVARTSALYFDASNPASIAAAIIRIGADESLRVRLVAAGHERAKDFTARQLVEGHVAAFATACRRHNPLRVWFNERVRLPRSQRPRTALTPREVRVAARLLHTRTRIPRGYEHVSP